VTVLVICDPAADGTSPLQFKEKQYIRNDATGYIFVLQSQCGKPLSGALACKSINEMRPAGGYLQAGLLLGGWNVDAFTRQAQGTFAQTLATGLGHPVTANDVQLLSFSDSPGVTSHALTVKFSISVASAQMPAPGGLFRQYLLSRSGFFETMHMQAKIDGTTNLTDRMRDVYLLEGPTHGMHKEPEAFHFKPADLEFSTTTVGLLLLVCLCASFSFVVAYRLATACFSSTSTNVDRKDIKKASDVELEGLTEEDPEQTDLSDPSQADEIKDTCANAHGDNGADIEEEGGLLASEL